MKTGRNPKGVVQSMGLPERGCLDAAITGDGSLLIRPPRQRFSLDELVNGITGRNRHNELDWGGAVGKEL